MTKNVKYVVDCICGKIELDIHDVKSRADLPLKYSFFKPHDHKSFAAADIKAEPGIDFKKSMKFSIIVGALMGFWASIFISSYLPFGVGYFIGIAFGSLLAYWRQIDMNNKIMSDVKRFNESTLI